MPSARRPWGISQKFILFVAAAILAFMLFTFLITGSMLEDFAMSSADETAELILQQTEKRLVSFFADLESLSRSLASTDIVRSENRVLMRDLFLSVVRARQGYLRAVYLGTVSGEMHEWGMGKGFEDSVPILPVDYDPRNRPWYRQAVRQDGFTISEPYRYASIDDIGITCALPVRDESGGLIGVLGLDMLLSSLGGVLDGLELPRGGKAFILGEGGMTIASQFQGFGPSLVVLQRLAAEKGGSFDGSVSGRRVKFVYKRVESLGWTVIVSIPLDPISDSVRSLLRLLGLANLALMLALVASLAWISNRLIVSPLRHIVGVMNSVESGKRDERVNVATRDEFGFLGGEFNRLLDTALQYQNGLEDMVRVRTEELRALQRENTLLKVDEERRRIYRDMHDTIGAKLTNIFFCNGVARDLAKESDPRLRDMLATTETNCLEAVSSLKRIILGLEDEAEPPESFGQALLDGMRRRLQARGITFECGAVDPRTLDALPARTRDELSKVAEELVSNVLKHSGAGSVRFDLERMPERGLCLLFSDDGAGWDPAVTGEGAGSGNIRYRVGRLGGTLSVGTAPGAGTRYRIELPPGCVIGPVDGAAEGVEGVEGDDVAGGAAEEAAG